MTRAPVDTTAQLYDAWPSITVRLVPFTPAANRRAKEWLRVPYDVDDFARRRMNLDANGSLPKAPVRTDYAVGDL